ncbi:MAG: DNA repair protein RadC [Gammaproteobacteria bacterium]|nr:DNA repair protein RadC [Gammaproteobacteria bacterium]
MSQVNSEDKALYVVEHNKHNKAEQAIIEQAQQIILKRFERGEPALDCPAATGAYLQVLLAAHEHEVFAVLMLDNRNRVIAFREMFRGTIDGASVYPREVVKQALADNAAAVIFAHNHPSGVVEPSESDIRITERLKSALALVDIRVLDHVIVAESCIYLSERGLV